MPFTVESVVQAVKDTVRANGFTDCYIRPLLYIKGGAWNLNVDAGKPALAIAVWQWSNYLGEEALAKGIRANISSYTRHHPNVSMTKAKIAGNYVNSFLAKTESERLGFQEAIMLDPQGNVGECTGENIFVVRRGKIFTPATSPVLEGITRHTVFTIAQDLGYDVQEQTISRDQLYIADEVFVCGTAAEVIGLSEIDFRTIGDGKSGKVTREIQNVYHDLIRGKVAKYENWCEYVDADQAVKMPAKESISAG
jgi:branched-chain amino acid aminotransferase